MSSSSSPRSATHKKVFVLRCLQVGSSLICPLTIHNRCLNRNGVLLSSSLQLGPGYTCLATPSRLQLRNQLRGAQQKAAPCPRIMGFSPRCGVVQARDVYKEGSGVLASEARVRANGSERVRGSQFTWKHRFNYKTWGHTINTCSYNQFNCH